jgi:hypothetical protein
MDVLSHHALALRQQRAIMRERTLMDLLAAQRRHGKHWNIARIGALLCFIVAGGILVASLLRPQPVPGATESGLSARISGTR